MSNERNEKTCKQLVGQHLKSRMGVIEKLWEAEKDGIEEGVEDLGTFNEYGLSFDYVAPGTFEGQRKGYFRYQISWGGPSDEFRFFANPGDLSCYRIEYWYMDWYDGARRILRGHDLEVMQEIWEMFVETETAQMKLNKSLKN